MRKTIIVLSAILICVVLLTGILMYYIFPNKSSHENEYLTVKEFEDDFVFTTYRTYIHYKAGDVVRIKDNVLKVELFTIPEIAINKTDVDFSTFTDEYITFTNVTFSDNQTLIFKGDRSEQFKVGEIVTFELDIKEYDFIPYYTQDAVPPKDFDEVHYNEHYILLHYQLLYKAMYEIYNITLQVEEINNTQCLISFQTFNPAWLDINYQTGESHWEYSGNFCSSEDIKIILWEDGIKTDVLFPNNTNLQAERGIIRIIPQRIFYQGETWEGDEILINKSTSGIQNYILEIYWRHTYPEPGFEKERLIGSISWKM